MQFVSVAFLRVTICNVIYFVDFIFVADILFKKFVACTE